MSCVFMGESYSLHITTLKGLVTIGILIDKRTIYEHKNGTFWEEVPRNLKKTYFPLVTTFYNLTLKMKSSWAKKVLKPIL